MIYKAWRKKEKKEWYIATHLKSKYRDADVRKDKIFTHEIDQVKKIFNVMLRLRIHISNGISVLFSENNNG